MIVLLDSGPLGRLTSPKATVRNQEFVRWLESLVAGHATVLVPEICDYEIRRELIRRQLRGESVGSLKILNELGRRLGFLPINSSTMLRAAELWAQSRNAGVPTAPPESLDCDVILAAQADDVGGTVATENVDHLVRLLGDRARHWRDLQP